jgi:IS1 family transposase
MPMLLFGQKKTETVWVSRKTEYTDFELDEVFWFIGRKEKTKTRENLYIMTMISRVPRQIVGFSADSSRTVKVIQEIVLSTKKAKRYNTDGYSVYAEIYYGAEHKQNFQDKSDTHIVESINADLRHYIPGLRRRSRCFYRSIETVRAVLGVFINAYNKYGEEKLKYKPPYRNLPLSVIDFL